MFTAKAQKRAGIVGLICVLALTSCQSNKPQETNAATEETFVQVDSGITHLDGVKSLMVHTDRIDLHVLTYRDEGIPVVFLHGNFSAATYWEEIMTTLPEGFRAIAPDLRGYGWSEDKLIDATNGAHDWADDVDALMNAMKIEKAHIVGWSMGGGVCYAYLADHPGKVLSVTLVSPVSPYGFGGTHGADGIPNNEDFSGSGGGTVNPQFIAAIQAGDRTDSTQNSPRNIINTYYYKTGFKAAREEDFLTASLMEKTGDKKYPGDFTTSDYWPNIGPGAFGPINALSPKYVISDVDTLLGLSNKPPVLWVHGSDDMIVGDNSFFDLATLGKLEYIPGWPGEAAAAPQPMLEQTRYVLEKYQENGGTYQELVIQDAGHASHIEKPAEFNKAFHAHISAVE